MNASAVKPDLVELDLLQEDLAQPLPEKYQGMLEQAMAHEKWPIAQLISLYERSGRESLLARHQVGEFIKAHPEQFTRNAMILGVTGTPGAGKSSLIGALCMELLQRDENISIAVLAVDPSSRQSGGALLGDRTRTHFPTHEKRLFFRSQASQLDLGGMARSTYHVTRLLRRLFDVVIIETVGIGQSEIEIQGLSDHTLLVMQPLAGDQVQFMKAGIMEVPDTFVINKCDEDELARKSLHLLKSSLKLARLQNQDGLDGEQQIFMTSATRNKGIAALAGLIRELMTKHASNPTLNQEQAHEEYFLQKWISQAYGEFGLGILAHFREEFDMREGSFEQKELRFKRLVSRFLNEL
ncbi:MAG: GTP-binding protein [Oleiphilaceae bacterium]|nr:GTP-binding protein [Oleiphilaceae bacterium]